MSEQNERELERKEEKRRKEEEEERSREGDRVHNLVQVTANFHFLNHFSYVIKFCNYFFGLSS